MANKGYYRNSSGKKIQAEKDQELLSRNKALKRTYKNFMSRMDEMVDKRAQNIIEISKKQLEIEVKLVEMRYGNDEFLVKKDLKEFVEQLENKNIELKAYNMEDLLFFQ